MYHTPENSDLPWTEGGKKLLDLILKEIASDDGFVLTVVFEKEGKLKMIENSRPNSKWTKEATEYLLKNYARVSISLLAKTLRKSEDAVRTKYSYLKWQNTNRQSLFPSTSGSETKY